MKKAISCFIPLALAAIVCGAFFPQTVKVSADNPAKAVTETVADGLTYRKFEYEDNGKQTLLFHFMDTLYMALYDSPIYRLSSSRCSTVKIASQRQKILAKSFNCNRYQRNNFCACSLTSVKPTIK